MPQNVTKSCYFVAQNVEEGADIDSLISSASALRGAAAFALGQHEVFILTGTSTDVVPVLIPKKYGKSLDQEVKKIFKKIGINGFWFPGKDAGEVQCELAYVFVVEENPEVWATGFTPEFRWREKFLDVSREADSTILVLGQNPVVGDYAWQRYDAGDLGTGVIMADSADEEVDGYVGAQQLSTFGIEQSLLDPDRYK